MKPIILYEENENTFTSNGLGTLDEAISAEITEELNGTYEMTFTYPVTGLKFSEIKHSRIVKAVASPGGDYQLFRIYGISKAINGIITVNAEHISYQLSYIVVNPFTATSAVDAMAKLSVNATSDCPFEFWTDKQTVANYKQETPDNIRARLAGVSGSILDVYGGEYEFDNYTVKLHNHRGQNRNVTLRYGKNITDIEQEENIASTYTSIVGFWKGEDEVVKTAVIDSQYASAYPFKRVKVVDFSQEYETAPTVVQLTARATSYMNSNNFGIPNVSIKVSFVALWQTEEYKDIAVLERVYLGDTVSVYYEKLGITASAKVVRMRYNVLLDRYDSIELGKLRSNLSNKLAKQDIEIKEQITDARSALERAVEHATDLIRGGLGGHVVLNTDADGKPQEILVMDTDDIHTATKVWRWNLGGLGYSKTGYDGNYGTAITMDGAIVADFITAGTMQANRVRAGLLQDETGTNYWNLTTGELRISTGTKVGSETDTMASIMSDVSNLRIDVNNIDLKVSGIFANYTGALTPTNSNYPASSWDVTDRPLHVGEVYFKTPQTEQDTGVYYRYNLTNGVYGWGVIDTTNGGYSVVTSEFKQTKNEIDLKVNKGDVVSEINLSSDTIQLNTAGRLLITAGNFKLDNTGHVTASGATLTGGSLTIDNPNYGKSIIDINYPDADVQYLLDIGAGGMEWNAKYSSLSKNGELTVESATIKDATITQANLSGCSITDGIFEVGDEVTIIGDPFYFKIDSDNKTIEWNMPNSSMSADGSLYIENGNVACKITSGTSSGSKIEIENGSITGYYNNNYCANIGLSLSNNLYQLKLKGRDQIVLEENSGTIAYFNTVASSIKSDRLDVDGMIVSDDSIIAKNFQVVQSGASSSTPGLTGVIPFRMPNGGTGYITVYGGIIINAPTQ